MLDSMTMDKQLEAGATKAEKTQDILKRAPTLIYVG